MEVTGFALSVASAASLFVTCIQCFDIVVKGKNFSEDYEQLYTLFALQRTRFGLWGESVGLIPDPYGRKKGYDTNLDRPDIRPLVESTLNNIRLLLQKVDQVDDKYNIEKSTSQNKKFSTPGPYGLQVFKTPFDRFKSQIKKNQKGASPWKVTQWAIHDEAKLRGIIERLREYVDGLESVTNSLGLWADQRARLNDEIENISDVESLKLLRDANSGQLVSAQPDISDKASRRLINIAESIFEQKALDSGSMVGQEDDSFVTAYSNPSELRPTIDLLIPGSWPKSISSAILGPRLILSTQPDDGDTAQTTRFEASCSECLKENHDCERLPNSERCLSCDRSDLVCQLVDIDEIPPTEQDENRQMPQNQRWLAEIMRKWKPHISQSFQRGETDYGKHLSAIKAEDEEHCQNTSIKLIAQAEVGSSSAKRMFLELRNIRTGKVPFVSAAPVGDSLEKVLASIEGPLETPYEGGVFWIAIRISQKNSLGPPLMKFQTRVYHPNISPQGHICADFGDKWNTFDAAEKYNTNVTSMWYRGKSSTPQWTLGALLTAICGLLACPDIDDPLVPEIAQLYLEDYDAYCENARVYTKRYATGERPDEASLSFLEEEVQPINSGRLQIDPDHAGLNQSWPVPRQDDDARSMRVIRDYDDQYPEAFRAPTWKTPQRDTKDNNNDQDEEYDEHELSDDSTQTYVSSVDEEYSSEDLDYEYQEHRESLTDREPRASKPDNFSKFFPSQRRLLIRHDATTYDGNMNLRIDTEVKEGGDTVPLTLFHVRMHNLKSREFSIRRYERSSGREVCHTSRLYKNENTSKGRQEMTFNDALATSRAYSSSHRRRTSSVASTRSRTSTSSLKSVPEDPDSNDEEGDIDDHETSSKSPKAQIPTNTTKLEFSNYARVDVSRREAKKTKRYEFEYWGTRYFWKRTASLDGSKKQFSFHLLRDDDKRATIAHIVPELRSPSQVHEEEMNGGWIPPCSLWISDVQLLEALTDIADVVVCTGLVALIDDCIKTNFSQKRPRAKVTSTRMTGTGFDVPFVSPRAMVQALFKRGKSTEQRAGLSPSGSGLRKSSLP